MENSDSFHFSFLTFHFPFRQVGKDSDPSTAHCCSPLTANCLRFKPRHQQRFGKILEILKLAGCNLHAGGEYTANSLRQEFGGDECRGADEFYNISTTTPMLAHHLWIRSLHQAKQR